MKEKLSYSSSIKVMLTKVQPIDIVKAFLSVLLAIGIIFFIIAPYLHIFIDGNSKEKVWGFKNLRYFMYVIGLPMSLFLCATLLLIASKYIKEKFVKVFFSTISFLFLWSSFFQFTWILWEGEDLSKGSYYFSASSISILVALIFKKMLLSRKVALTKLQNIVNALSRFSFITAKKHIKEESKEKYNDDLLNTLKEGMDHE